MAPIKLLLNKAVFACRRTSVSYRLPLALTAIAAVLLSAACAYYSANQSALLDARREANTLSKWGQSVATTQASGVRESVDLKAFRSSHLLSLLEQSASSAAVKLDEISFAVDDAPNQPYVRYRATFSVIARYPTIRKFISGILAGSEGVVLDTVSCRREDVSAVDVRCDISAYVAYQEKVGG
jgi:hypothetical protein